MRRRYIKFVVVFVVMFQILELVFSQVYAETNNSSKQPEVCAWPSETMSLYFDFQRDAISAISHSKAFSKKISASKWTEWLFSKGSLEMPTTALDLLAWRVSWWAGSLISKASTSLTLLMLGSASVVESNLEWLAIFFRDRPIVRDYREMQDIDTEIFNLTYNFSKKVDLTQEFDWDVLDSFKNIVKQYQDKWLLKESESSIPNNASMANILYDMVSMNAAMKYFITMWWEAWAVELRKYAWCVWKYKWDECSVDSHYALWFSSGAISKLKEEYKGLRFYWACNEYASNFKNTTSKAARNNSESVKAALNDVKVSATNLKNALIGKWRWKLLSDPCNMSDYEMAQLESYRWWDWKCWEWISLSSLYLKMKWYVNNKSFMEAQVDSTDNVTKQAWRSEANPIWNIASKIELQKTTEDKRLMWHKLYSGATLYNTEFSRSINDSFFMVFDDVEEDFSSSQIESMAADLTFELIKIKWLVDQVDEAMAAAASLKQHLEELVALQCAN